MRIQSSTRQVARATRTSTLYLARGQSNYAALKEATCRMWRALRAVPKEVQNVVYGFTRAQPRTKRGHLMGAWPELARVCATHGAPLIDVMAPAYEVERELRREIYRPQLPTLVEAETREAECQLRLHTAEIASDRRALREATIAEKSAAQTLLEVLDTQDGEPLYV